MIEKDDNGHHYVLYTMGELAKMLNLKDSNQKPIGRNRLFRVLRNPINKVLCKDNTPSQFMINMGLAVLHRTTKRYKTYTVTCFTDKGIAYLENGFASGKYQVVLEPKKQSVPTVRLEDVC